MMPEKMSRKEVVKKKKKFIHEISLTYIIYNVVAI